MCNESHIKNYWLGTCSVVEHLPSIPKTSGLIFIQYRNKNASGMVTGACNLRTLEVEARGSEVQGHATLRVVGHHGLHETLIKTKKVGCGELER